MPDTRNSALPLLPSIQGVSRMLPTLCSSSPDEARHAIEAAIDDDEGSCYRPQKIDGRFFRVALPSALKTWVPPTVREPSWLVARAIIGAGAPALRHPCATRAGTTLSL